MLSALEYLKKVLGVSTENVEQRSRKYRIARRDALLRTHPDRMHTVLSALSPAEADRLRKWSYNRTANILAAQHAFNQHIRQTFENHPTPEDDAILRRLHRTDALHGQTETRTPRKKYRKNLIENNIHDVLHPVGMADYVLKKRRRPVRKSSPEAVEHTVRGWPIDWAGVSASLRRNGHLPHNFY